MLYQSQKMILKTVMVIFEGKVNDAYVCERVDAKEDGQYYLVLQIHEHHIANQFLHMVQGMERKKCYVDTFNLGEDFCFVFEYVEDRKLSEFLDASKLTVDICHTICTNLVIRCMESSLPYPVLYLILEQKQIQLSADNDIFLSPAVDLSELNMEWDEKKCLTLLAGYCRDILHRVNTRKNISYQLLLKKIPKQRYTTFHELYRDLCLSKTEEKSLWTKMIEWFRKHKRQFEKFLIILTVICIVLAIFIMINMAIWGEVPLFRLFHNTFSQIGSESLQ